jgi:hypothetical protein
MEFVAASGAAMNDHLAVLEQSVAKVFAAAS